MESPGALPALLLPFLFAYVIDVGAQIQGPVFLSEPPARLVFSNTVGARADCSVLGNPPPTIAWLVHDVIATTVPGLRIPLENGSMVFPAFPAQEFRQGVHGAVYRCRASNAVGIILSREVHVNAVITSNYEPRVLGSHASIGSPVVLTCDRRDHITVISWLRNDVILVAGQPETGSRYITTGRGELLIRSVQLEDVSATYSCLVLNTLTGERKRSASVVLTLNDIPTGMAPRLLAPVSEITIDNGRELYILCTAVGSPNPLYSWYRETAGHVYPVLNTPRIVISQDVLLIRHVQPPDSGSWVCKARNQYGEQQHHTMITITEPLTVHLQPQLLIANTGSNAIFNCTASGSNTRIRWLHDGVDVTSNSRGHSLMVSRVARSDRGMYQCLVSDGQYSVQASAELRLGDMAPELQYTFIEQALRGGPDVSLRCSAAGAPSPRFHWLLDGQPLNEIASSHRYSSGQYIAKNGDAIGHLNISNVRTEDGGLYTCVASNNLGEASHTARLNIYGPPSIRSIGPIRMVAGTNTTLHCPYAGYPISSVRWLRRGQEITNSMRLDTGSLGDLHVTRVDPSVDTGSYTCIVQSSSGETVKKDLQIVVKNPPKLVPFSFPPDLEEGSSAQLLCGMTSGDRPIYFSWLKDGMPIPASLQIQEKSLDEFSFLIFSDVSSKHSGDYTCVASNIAAKVNYTAQLMVKVSPHWIYEPQDISTLLGTPIIIQCGARGFPEPKITWWYKGQGSSSQDFHLLPEFDNRLLILSNGSLIIPAASPNNEGQYMCKAENGIGLELSKIIHFTVNEPAHFEMTSKNISSRRNDPITLLCEVFGDNPIQVQWTHNLKRIDLNTYRISMSEVRTETGLRSQLSLTRTERRDSGTYRCQAENAFGRSEHVIYLAVQERPDPPMSLQVVEVGGRSVELSWLKSFDGNTPLLGYLAQYQLLGSINKDDWVSAKVVNISLDKIKFSQNSEDIEKHGGVVGVSEAIVCETIVTGLHPATAYTVRLAAYNSIEHSAYSEPVVVKTQEEAPMEAPNDVQVQPGGQGELQVTWKAPSHDSWNGELLGYLVTWSEFSANNPFPTFNSNTSKSLTVNGWANTEVTITGLRKFTRYGVTVSAFNGVSAGPASLPVSAITQEGVPEAAPMNIVCAPLSSQSVKVSWESPHTSLHGGVLQGYKVIYKPAGSQDSKVAVAGEIKRTSSIETYLHGLRRYTNYSIQILAFTAAGDGQRSLPTFCVTEEDLPGPPSNVKALASSEESVLVSWLPPLMKNGRILHYTVFWREAGRVGKQSTVTVTTENAKITSIDGYADDVGDCMITEVHGLVQHRLYEFWVSASTVPGEGEPTPIVAQGPNIKVPARIASFGQNFQLPLHSAAVLSCMAVGNPTPRTRWMYRGRPVTHGPHYQVSQKGHLEIHSMDSTLSGNYTCSAKNLYGEDSIIYGISALLPPGIPQLRLQHASTSSLRLSWPTPQDGGSVIQGYTLHYAKEGQSWQAISLAGELQSYTLEGLVCGSPYLIYIVANNAVDKGPPSQRIRVFTKGGVSKVPNEKDLISTNSSCVKLNLLTWDNGGCPIKEFIIEYKSMADSLWAIEKTGLRTEGLVIDNLKSSNWYYLKVTAINGAGSTTGKFYFSTLTPEGARIASPAVFPPHWETDHPTFEVFGRFSAILAGISLLGLIALVLLLFVVLRSKRSNFLSCPFKGYSRGDVSEDEKSVENQDNRRNCQQVYSSSPIKHSNGKTEQSAEMYEISPYATFSMNSGPGGGATGGRSLTASTLDYTVQFRTFGRSDGEALGPAPGRPNLHGHDRRSNKHRSFSSSDEYTLSKAMTMAAGGPSGHSQNSRCRVARHGGASVPPDSESDSSGSPCTECNSNPSYRVPINTPKDMFRPVADSSAESQSEMSPNTLGDRSKRTPRRSAYHTGGRFAHRQEQERREFTIHV